MFLLFSHKLTPLQTEDAKRSLGIKIFIYLPKDLQDIWSQIPPDIEYIDDWLDPIKEFLMQNAKPQDMVLIQGDFGATCHMVNFTKDLNLIPIYSTNKRVVREFLKDNRLIKVSEFVHQIFRRF